MGFQGKKVFVSGGRTGFLGANLVEALLKQGATVFAHSLHAHKSSFFPLATPSLIQLTQDLSESATIPLGTDYVFHCAAHTGGAHEMVNNPLAQVNENAKINTNILEAARLAKVKKICFISSSAVYPDSESPLLEEDGFQGDPPGNYFGPAWMKRYSEKLAEFYSRQHGLDVLVIRPSNIYGPYSSFDLERAHVLPALIRKFLEAKDEVEVWGVPEVVRDFIFVDDFVEGLFAAFQRKEKFEVFNIATGSDITIGAAVEIIQELTGFRGRVSFNSQKPMTIKKRRISTAKAESLLGFTAKTSFSDGLKKTIHWYQENRRAP